MKKIINTLYGRFEDKGFKPIEILSLIRDVLYITAENKNYTRSSLNRELEWLGWGMEILDETAYPLITSLLEKQGYHN